MMSIRRAILVGFIQASGLALYCTAVAKVMLSLVSWFPTGPAVAPLLFLLLLFVFSAVVSAAIVLGYPIRLAWHQRLREAGSIVAATMGWVGIFMISVVIVLASTK